MPYIRQEIRPAIIQVVNGVVELYPEVPNNPGELQYLIAVALKYYQDVNGRNYQTCNDIMGALAGAQMEFYRTVVAPFEDEAIKRNGPV